MCNKIIKIVLTIIVFSLVISSISVANNEEESSTKSPEQIFAEESQAAYIAEMTKAFKSVEVPDVANLPTLLRQPSFHPYETDHFGKGTEEYPIFEVKVTEGDTKREGKIALTFDSAYINKYTYKILDILDKYNAKATFFMTYEFMTKNKNQVMEIVKRGNEIGNHSTTHPDFNKVTDAKVVTEVLQCHNYIKTLFGADMCLFRFPFGSYSPRTVNLLKQLGYYPIQWTFDSIDWKNLGVNNLIGRFEDNKDEIKEGAIILFHNGATYTPEFLPHFFKMLNEKGLSAVRVSDLIYPHNFYVDIGCQYENIKK